MTNTWKKILIYASLPISVIIAYFAINRFAEDMSEIDLDDLYSTEDDDGWC